MMNGGPAYPYIERTWCTDTDQWVLGETVQGMSLRDHFAGKAMLGLIGKCGPYDPVSEAKTQAGIAKHSYAIADAMLLARGTP